MPAAGRIGEAAALLDQLRTLADHHPDELPLVSTVGLAAVQMLMAQLNADDAKAAKATARSAESLLRHPAFIAEMRQRLGQDSTGRLEGLIEALLSDG